MTTRNLSFKSKYNKRNAAVATSKRHKFYITLNTVKSISFFFLLKAV